jgi:hypothetical protein
MIVTLFYILSALYLIRMNFDVTFNPVGTEFASLVILGFVVLLYKK